MSSKQKSNINLKTLSRTFLLFHRLSLTTRASLLVAIAAATALGCGWSVIEHSVRFNDLRCEKEFGRLPPLPAYKSDGRTSPSFGDWSESEYARRDQYLEKIKEIWGQAEAAQAQGDM